MQAADMAMDPNIGTAMRRLGVVAFRGKQQEAITARMSGADLLYVFPTGCGKSLVYQCAALCSEGITIIVCPLLGLLREQTAELSNNGVESIVAHGGILDVYGSAENVKLVYSTPEQLHANSRLVKMLEHMEAAVSRIVVDEAHVLQEWDDFRCRPLQCCPGLCSAVHE